MKGGYLCILRSNGQRSRSLQNFANTGSDTITWVVFNVQLSYFIHRCRIVRGRHLYIWGQKIKGQCQYGTLSTLSDWHNNLSSFQRTAFIFSYIDAGWWEDDTQNFGIKRSKVKVSTELCQNFGTNTTCITCVVFNTKHMRCNEKLITQQLQYYRRKIQINEWHILICDQNSGYMFLFLISDDK